jgi:2-polyprenyl-3-methyl-5-hydroxy-6-metoxy-1,4-benzoquinol methylase
VTTALCSPLGETTIGPHELRSILDRTARRYRCCDRFTRHYVAAKLRTDPVHADILALAAQENFGRVIDVGCGRGQLGMALLEAGLAESVLGLDCNDHAIGQARRAAAALAFHAETRDLARDSSLGPADTVMMIDVLYQLEPAAQDALLRSAAGAAPRRILIRTQAPSRTLRFRAILAWERLFRPVWPAAGSHVNRLSLDRLVNTLRDLGFASVIAPCSRGTPFTNVLLLARPGTVP